MEWELYVAEAVVETKLTLRMDEEVLRRGKEWARRRRKSLSRVVADYLAWLARCDSEEGRLPPRTARLVGVLRGTSVSVDEHRRHLEEKHR